MTTLVLLKEFVDLQGSYGFEKRNLVTPERYKNIAEAGLIELDNFDNPALVENLTEHVGHLPIIAAFFHPYLEHSGKIDLGRVLTMLAIHDIGETVVGDVYSFKKDEAHDAAEKEAALNLLHSTQKDIYLEFEEKGSLEAKYAHSVDKLAPLLAAITIPQVTIQHALQHGLTIEMVAQGRESNFTWDKLLSEVFDLCVEHYLNVREGGEGLL